MDVTIIAVSPIRDERATNMKKHAQLYLSASLLMPYKVWLDDYPVFFFLFKYQRYLIDVRETTVCYFNQILDYIPNK